MTKQEEIEFDRVIEALDVAKRRLRDMAKLRGGTAMWAQNVLAEIEAAEVPNDL